MHAPPEAIDAHASKNAMAHRTRDALGHAFDLAALFLVGQQTEIAAADAFALARAAARAAAGGTGIIAMLGTIGLRNFAARHGVGGLRIGDAGRATGALHPGGLIRRQPVAIEQVIEATPLLGI